jgi:hypothetical protein
MIEADAAIVRRMNLHRANALTCGLLPVSSARVAISVRAAAVRQPLFLFEGYGGPPLLS